MTPKGRTKAPDDGSRQLAAIGYGCLVLLGAAIYTVDVSTSSRVKTLQFGPIEAAAMGIIHYAPPLKPLSQLLMIPATYGKRASLVLRQCVGPDKSRCSAGPLTQNLEALFEEADQATLLDAFKTSFPPTALRLLLMGGIVTAFTAIVGIYRPIRMGAAGLILMTLGVYLSPVASFLPTLLMLSFLAGYIAFYDLGAFLPGSTRKKRPQASRAAASPSTARPSAAGASTPGGKAGSGRAAAGSPAGGGSSKKAAKRAAREEGRTKLYDI